MSGNRHDLDGGLVLGTGRAGKDKQAQERDRKGVEWPRQRSMHQRRVQVLRAKGYRACPLIAAVEAKSQRPFAESQNSP